jgi:hypothetical protein
MSMRLAGVLSSLLAVAIVAVELALPCRTVQRPVGAVLVAWSLIVLAIVGRLRAPAATWLAMAGAISGVLALLGFFC